MRIQSGHTIGSVAMGRPEPDGRLVVSLRPGDETATHVGITILDARLAAVEPVRQPCPGVDAKANR